MEVSSLILLFCFNKKFNDKIMHNHVYNYCHTIKIVYFTLYLIEILSRTMSVNDFYKV